jgi:hypothetical protein
MVDSDLQKVYQSAHWYTECSSAGVCDRETGECECYEGFEGVACHRLKCPGEEEPCSGHGICQTLDRIARKNENSRYNLWSRDLVQGCVCDPGFSGFDCSMRSCPKGIDPLFYDDVQTIQYPFFFFSFMTTSSTFDLTNGINSDPAYFNIIVFDAHDQPYPTRQISLPTTCSEMIGALEEIPNHVIPLGSVACFHNDFEEQNAVSSRYINVTYRGLYKSYFGGIKVYVDYEKPASMITGSVGSYKNLSVDSLLTGQLFNMQFYGNPGNFRQPILNVYSDGDRPTIQSAGGVAVARTWTNGQHGTEKDFFSRRCANVRVKLKTVRGETFMWGGFLWSTLLKCLGEADFDPENNLMDQGFSYDAGTIEYPHAIKLVRTVADAKDGSLYAVIVLETGHFDTQGGEYLDVANPNAHAFRVLHPIHSFDFNENDLFDVYTTRGVLHRVQNGTRAEFDFASNHIFLTNVSDVHATNTIPFRNEEVSCESYFNDFGMGTNTSQWNCIDKNDYFFLVDPFVTKNNPPYMNMYRVESIRKVLTPEMISMGDFYPDIGVYRSRDHAKWMITSNLNTNWESTVLGGANFQMYRFIPDYNDVYDYIAECSGRGLCNTFEGLCDCFHGYTGAACDIQTSIVS